MTTPQAEDPHPDWLPFPLQEGEGVIAIRRKHWIYLWPYIVGQVLLATVSFAVLWWVLDKVSALDGIVSTIFTVFAVLWVVFWIVRIILKWYRYRHDLWVITNQRLIDSHRNHPLDLQISTADLVNVQDMSIDRSGLLRTAFDFGDIVCQTASQTPDFRLAGIPDPRETQALVDRERDRERLRMRGV